MFTDVDEILHMFDVCRVPGHNGVGNAGLSGLSCTGIQVDATPESLDPGISVAGDSKQKH